MEMTIHALDELPGAAAKLIDFAGDERIFLFYGEMGVGKTTFIKTLCRELGVEDTVSSPTFSIVNEYDVKPAPVYHFDFYRLKKESEALDLGYEDYFYSGSYCFIEWPEKIPNLIPPHYLKIALTEDENTVRTLKVTRF